MDHILALRAFLRISETGAFGRAADQLNLPRSTVSKLIQDLENHLGVGLVQRTNCERSTPLGTRLAVPSTATGPAGPNP